MIEGIDRRVIEVGPVPHNRILYAPGVGSHGWASVRKVRLKRGYPLRVAESWDDIIGKHVLVGITYVDNEDAVIEQRQMHGTVVRADDEGVYMEVAGSDEEQWLPPHLPAYQEAEEGEYRLRSTGEVVIDPDLLCTWTIRPGPGR